MQTLLRPSDRPNDSKRTLFRELGTSTVRFTVHGKMLTMSTVSALTNKKTAASISVRVPAHLATRPVCRRARRQMGRPICQHFVPSADGQGPRRSTIFSVVDLPVFSRQSVTLRRDTFRGLAVVAHCTH